MSQAEFDPGRVAVLLGGLSTERSVSFKSGRDVAERLRAEAVDVAFPVLHGKWGEDGSIQGLLECMGIPYAGPSVFSAALTMDKVTTVALLAGAGVPVPRGVVVERGQPHPEPPPLPVVVKPVREGSSYGVSRVFAAAELPGAVEAALALDDRALVEELIEGPELTVGVLAGRALPVVEIAPKDTWFDFEAKYSKGATEYFVPARIERSLAEEVQRIALRAAELCRCTTSCRVDVMAGGARGPRVLEVNTIPGMTDTSLLPMAAAAVGVDFPELCDRLLRGARLHNGEPAPR
jgi:D-alanine-D-alanine ligase